MEEETLNPQSKTLTSEDDNNGDQPMPDLPDQDPSSSDSDSDSGSDDGDQAQKNLQLQTLEAELSTNPGNYDAHVQYIKIIRQIADIEKLRQAREAMNELFPLTPSMWQDWAKDEASLSTGSDAFPAIEKLYERGVFEYLSISLWRDYLDFVQENDPSVRECSPAGILKARDLFERALTAAGLHVSEGSKLWEAYRKFEQAIFDATDETDNQARDKQIQRIRTIFHRQLSVPHVNMRSTLLDYKAWEVEQGNILNAGSSDLDGISSHVASAYKKALEMYNARVHLEEQICRQDMSDSEKLQNFMNYLKFEQSSGDPARVQMLYERAITEFPISSYLWLDYTHYLDKTLKVGSIITNVYSRAVKNCPCVGELWVRYLLSWERGHASEKEIAAVFEKSLQCILTLDEFLDLYLTRIDGLRRRISCPVEGESVLDYSLIRETFQNASEYFSQYLKNTDGLLRLHAYWARLELNLHKDLQAARGVWESLLKICGSMLEAWQGYITMEAELGHVSEARSLYRRCYSKRFPGTGSEDICYSWLRFEREFGSLDDFDRAVQKVTPRLEELQLFRSQQESKLTEEGENSSKKNVRDKRKQVSEIPDEHYPAKRQKDASQKPKKAHGKDSDVLNPGERTVEKIKPKGDKPDIQNEQQMKERVPEKTKVYADQCTAFVSNINLKANDEHLRQFFSDVGGVVAIRLLHDKFSGKSRGLAYVDFSDDAHLVAAVAKNKQMLLGKKLSIARSDPKHGKKEHGRGSESRESAETSNGPRAHQALQPSHNRGSDNVQLRGRNTFAIPRNVLALGQTANKPKTEEQGEEKPKSNDEFRNMFLKG
ncbi:PREDICTED: squamous cell carcinoma antigen recognized by T-cells 3 [Prunus mume]|uniref:Squamous cell carcinoma antigen recognized by T-cells 3 n=1 Tax=Prunus mume TaxID=102107 RepID=A0ABM0N2P6_PRUMU|nr:PREDICTED: squamous cell carcinoma antigen recognized by T-cells 3 [Prunus mume]